MYKIYVKDTQLILCESKELQSIKEGLSKVLIGRYTGKVNDILSYVDLMEKSNKYKHIILYSDNFEKLKIDFKSLYKKVPAAGGLVVNELGEGLFIFKRGAWDLPKGKKDEGESNKMTAVREVIEETGVCNIKCHYKICVTRHTFKTKHGIRAIKKTHWYAMTGKKQILTPQEEEGIEKVGWLHIEPFVNKQLPIYDNLLKVLTRYQSMKSIHDLSGDN